MKSDNNTEGSGYESDVRGRGHNTGWEDQYPTVRRGGKTGSDYDGEDSRQHQWGEHSTAVPKQSNRGKGPKGYKRTDSRIEEDVNEALSQDHDLDSTEIEVSVSNSEVMLSGHVVSKQDKRLAEDIAESIPGVINVENRMRIGSPS